MASFYGVTLGEQIEFQRVLAAAGFTKYDIRRIIEEPTLASAMHQAIKPNSEGETTTIEGPPSWYVSPERQLEQVRRLNELQGWGFLSTDFPSVPENFTPRTATEVLLLTVSLPARGKRSSLRRTFNNLWNLIEAPEGYDKYRWEKLKATTKSLRRAPGYSHEPGIRWVAFDPNTYQGLSPEAALKQSEDDNIKLAGCEVLMAKLLFPDWATSWNGKSSPYPNLSALQFYQDTEWSHTPYLKRRNVGKENEVYLYVHWSDRPDKMGSSPTVRELN